MHIVNTMQHININKPIRLCHEYVGGDVFGHIPVFLKNDSLITK